LDRKDYYWWEAKPSQTHEAVFDYLKKLDQDQQFRSADNYQNMRLYGNYDSYNLKNYQYFKSEPSASVQNRITMNIVQSMVDTVTSKVTKNKPKPMFLTDGGDFTDRGKAKKLTQFIEGQFQSTKMYEKSNVAFLDSCIFGTGALKIFRVGEKIQVERTFPDEITIDDQEAIYGQPRQMHQRKFIHKEVLKRMFPKVNPKIIDDSMSDHILPLQTTMRTDSDMILVVESWRLPDGEDKKGKLTGGKHTMNISNHTLLDEAYEKDYFPFVFHRWGLRQLGFFGQGLAEQLTGLQLEINKILRTIQISMHLVSIPKVFVEMNSKVVSSHLDNKIGGVVKFSGQPPIPGQMGSIPTELFTHLDRLYVKAFEIAGVSQLSATAAKPAGLNSGKALRVYNDLETERFMSVMKRYEEVFLDSARIMIDLAKEIAEENPDYSVRVKGKKFFQTIKWKEVDLEEDKYVMGLFPTSALATTPGARIEDVQELLATFPNSFNETEAFKLLDFPDLEAYFSFKTAPGEDIDRMIESMIDDGKYETPEPYQDLAAGMSKMQDAYLLFKSQGAPENRLELFRRWIEDAKTMMDKAAQEAQAQQLQAQAASQQAAMATLPPEQQAIAAAPQEQALTEATAVEDPNAQT
jgi:hypothetical protein